MNKPVYLYKYEAITLRTLENLKAQCLFFGSPLNFNDPYDCALSPNIAELSDEEIERARLDSLADPDLVDAGRRAIEKVQPHEFRTLLKNGAQAAVKEHIQKFLATRGVTCFSEQNDNLLMWSHYGGSYKGICLEFSTAFEPFDKVRKVNYSAEFPEINAARLYSHDESDAVTNLFCTKSDAWAYEKEWRGIHMSVGKFGYTGACLTGVYFGPNVSSESKEIVCLILAGQNDGVKFYEGSRSPTQFRVEFREFTYVPHLEARRRGLIDESGVPIPPKVKSARESSDTI